MKIAQIAPIIERVPAKKYGGTERVVATLTEGLVRMGHDVTLFASGDSVTTAKLKAFYPTSLRASNEQDIYNPLHVASIRHLTEAYKSFADFDVIHDHTMQNSPLSLMFANVVPTPVVMTLHGPIREQDVTALKNFSKPGIVTISHDQARAMPPGFMTQTVYNGLDMRHYPFANVGGNYLLFVGRIAEQKGVHNAIAVAQALDLPLVIAGKLDICVAEDIAYFQQAIKPHLTNRIRWVGEVEDSVRNRLMANAKVFLHPITWPEPFGLTLIESMACGTPVIAIGKGSIPELIQDGKTGFVVDTVDQMIAAVNKINQIDRAMCRDYALTAFRSERMVEGYVRFYQAVIAKHRATPLRSFVGRNQNQQLLSLLAKSTNILQ